MSVSGASGTRSVRWHGFREAEILNVTGRGARADSGGAASLADASTIKACSAQGCTPLTEVIMHHDVHSRRRVPTCARDGSGKLRAGPNAIFGDKCERA
jgi:hypothetical protein